MNVLIDIIIIINQYCFVAQCSKSFTDLIKVIKKNL